MEPSPQEPAKQNPAVQDLALQDSALDPVLDPALQEIAAELGPLGYEIKTLLSSSHQSILLKAQQTNLQRDIAVKILNKSALQSDVSEQRFAQEAKLLASFEHPNIVKLYGVGKLKDGRAYMLMEFVKGSSLAEIATGVPLNEGQVRDYAAQICSALAYAHEKHIVHRDLKPANVMLHQSDSAPACIKLIDFGIYKNTDATGQRLTQEGRIPGTANYMSPEQCRAEVLDARSDIYSLGCLLYELCSGFPPMAADSDWLIMSNHLNKEITQFPSTQLEYSESLKSIILRCLNKDPSQRWNSAVELKSTFEAKLVNDERQKWKYVCGVLLLLPVLCLVSFASLQPAKKKDLVVKLQPVSEIKITPSKLRLRYEEFEKMLGKKVSIEQKAAVSRLWMTTHLNDPHLPLGPEDFNKAYENCIVAEWKDIETKRRMYLRTKNDLTKLSRTNAQSFEGSYTMQKYCLLIVRLRSEVDFSDWNAGLRTFSELMNDPDITRDMKEEQTFILLEVFSSMVSQNNYPRAEELFRRYLDRAYPNEQKAKMCMLMGDLLQKRSGLDGAAKYFKLAFKQYENCRELTDTSLFQILCLRLNLIAAYDLVCRLAERFPPKVASDQTTEIAIQYLKAYLALGKTAEAEALLKNPILLQNAAGNRANQLRLQAWGIQSALASNRKDLLRERLLEALADPDETACASLGTVCERYPEFLTLCDDKLEGSSEHMLGILHGNHAHNLRIAKDYKASIKEYERSQSHFDKQKKDFFSGRLNVFAGAADSYMHLEEFGNARKILDEGKAYAALSKEKADWNYILPNSEANFCRAQKRYEQACQMHKKVLAEHRQNFPNSSFAGYIVAEIALDYDLMGQTDKAIAFIEENLPEVRRVAIFSNHNVISNLNVRDLEKQLRHLKEQEASPKEQNAN